MRISILLILSFFLINFLSAQSERDYDMYVLELPKENGKVIYQEVIEAKGVSAENLYNSARLWFLENFKYSKEVIQYESKETGIVSGNGNTDFGISSIMNTYVENTLFFTITIEVKEEKFRYKITDLSVTQAAVPSARTPIEQFFSEEWMYKKSGKPKEFMWDWYDAYIYEIHRIENSIQEFVKTNHIKKSNDW